MKKLCMPVFYVLLPLIIPMMVGLTFPRTTGSHISFPFSNKGEISDTITTLNVKTGTTEKIPMETYLVGVLAAEMPASYEEEALKAQAVAARSYIFSKLDTENPNHPSAQVCTDPNHCKGWLSEEDAKAKWNTADKNKYWKKLANAVKSTSGEYMTYKDQVVEAFFFASSGGKTENSEDVWSSSRPYLKSVESYGESLAEDNISTVTFTHTQLAEKLTPHLSQTLDPSKPPSIGEPVRTEGGSVSTISIAGKTFKGTELRSILGLKSANFTVSATDTTVTFTVKGYGHGVGMSQTGANYMAKEGYTYKEILSHYYTDIEFSKL
ncbi:MAG: stage II sporulation protein D [Clostridia bacterium]|nr:stage II sporulation protein D [Clostridia bacterium]